MIASLRWPSATPLSASTQTSPASGPRWRTVSIIASPIERSASADVAARQSIMPAMPHIAVYPVNILWLFAQTDVGDVVSTEAHITALELWHAANPARLYPDRCVSSPHLIHKWLTACHYDQVTSKR